MKHHVLHEFETSRNTNRSKNVATSCADIYAVARLATSTQPLYYT